jgi:hypothetical protein
MLGECDAHSNINSTLQGSGCVTQIEEQKTSVIRNDQTKEPGLVEVADCPGKCHDHSDAAA